MKRNKTKKQTLRKAEIENGIFNMESTELTPTPK